MNWNAFWNAIVCVIKMGPNFDHLLVVGIQLPESRHTTESGMHTGKKINFASKYLGVTIDTKEH